MFCWSDKEFPSISFVTFILCIMASYFWIQCQWSLFFFFFFNLYIYFFWITVIYDSTSCRQHYLMNNCNMPINESTAYWPFSSLTGISEIARLPAMVLLDDLHKWNLMKNFHIIDKMDWNVYVYRYMFFKDGLISTVLNNLIVWTSSLNPLPIVCVCERESLPEESRWGFRYDNNRIRLRIDLKSIITLDDEFLHRKLQHTRPYIS